MTGLTNSNGPIFFGPRKSVLSLSSVEFGVFEQSHSRRTIQAKGNPILRDLPPSTITGPTLVYKRVKSGKGSFFCSRCGLDFATTDPLEAFQDFAHHQHQCSSRPKPHRKTRAAS